MELLPEDGITLDDAAARHRASCAAASQAGKKLGIVIMSEEASPYYDTDFVRRIMDAEADGAFDVRALHPGPPAARRRADRVRPHPGQPAGRARPRARSWPTSPPAAPTSP